VNSDGGGRTQPVPLGRMSLPTVQNCAVQTKAARVVHLRAASALPLQLNAASRVHRASKCTGSDQDCLACFCEMWLGIKWCDSARRVSSDARPKTSRSAHPGTFNNGSSWTVRWIDCLKFTPMVLRTQRVERLIGQTIPMGKQRKTACWQARSRPPRSDRA
jgi:hypothetical protein